MGAFWYLFSIQRETACWKRVYFGNNTGDVKITFGCAQSLGDYYACSKNTSNSTPLDFDFGIFREALQSDVLLKSTNFLQKFCYCFWWGLRNLRFAYTRLLLF